MNVILLTDKRCVECTPDKHVSAVKSRIANPVIRTLDYSDSEGRAVYQEANPGNLPALVFDDTLDGDKDALESYGKLLRTSGRYRTASVGGGWNPVCADEEGCDRPECKGTLTCRKESPNKLEVFVMSQCPFGVKAMNAMQEVLADLGKGIDFSVHFIGNGDADKGLTSMHGAAEVEEDLRQICAIKYYKAGFRYMDYIGCRNKDIRSPGWEACAAGGIDAGVIRRCSEGPEGKRLLEAEFRYSQSVGINASPTWIANNKFKFNGIDSKAIKGGFCPHNRGARGCS